MDIWELLEAYRANHSLFQHEIEGLLGLSRNSYCKHLERGTESLPVTFWVKASKLLGIDLEAYSNEIDELDV